MQSVGCQCYALCYDGTLCLFSHTSDVDASSPSPSPSPSPSSSHSPCRSKDTPVVTIWAELPSAGGRPMARTSFSLFRHRHLSRHHRHEVCLVNHLYIIFYKKVSSNLCCRANMMALSVLDDVPSSFKAISMPADRRGGSKRGGKKKWNKVEIEIERCQQLVVLLLHTFAIVSKKVKVIKSQNRDLAMTSAVALDLQ